MSLQKQNVTKWPSANAKQVSTHKNWEEADAWMQQDKANRVVEGVQQYLWGHKQVEWERVDKSKPFGFSAKGHTAGTRWLNYYPEANQPGGCLWDSGFDRD